MQVGFAFLYCLDMSLANEIKFIEENLGNDDALEAQKYMIVQT